MPQTLKTSLKEEQRASGIEDLKTLRRNKHGEGLKILESQRGKECSSGWMQWEIPLEEES
jgi:hypothetical protein